VETIVAMASWVASGFHNLFIHNFSLSVLYNYKRNVPLGRFTAQHFSSIS